MWIADSVEPMVHVCCYFDWAFVDRQALSSRSSILFANAASLQSAYVGPVFPYLIPEHMKVEKQRIWIDFFEKFYTDNQYTNERTYIRSLKIQSSFQLFIEFFLSYALKEEHTPDPRMYKLLERIDQDLIHGKLQPWEVYYTELRISRGYFFDLFKQTTGLPPTQYANQFIINRAKDELRYSNLSITEIADKIGFTSIHYFSKLFRKMTGRSPREYREELRVYP